MPPSHALRRDRAAAIAPGLGADAVLITSGVNVRYLTGLVSSNAALLVPADGPAVLATDSRYAGTAGRECEDVQLVIERDVAPALVESALAAGLHAIAFEDRVMTVQTYRELSDAGKDELKLIAAGSAIDELRMVKDEDEIALL
ncbi:MAG TPA: aminopeptidase P family N-terminal domain-containing protein, partial [Streptosporangiaceae bacterium]|nr:aminopeptidase P family N-terminal domain-containing protein [Streptosporangiaceae bacterium]